MEKDVAIKKRTFHYQFLTNKYVSNWKQFKFFLVLDHNRIFSFKIREIIDLTMVLGNRIERDAIWNGNHPQLILRFAQKTYLFFLLSI